MTVKFWHLRAVDPELCVETGEDLILPTGGLTVAYTVCDVKGTAGIFVNFAKCRSSAIVDINKVEKRNAAIDKIFASVITGSPFAIARDRLARYYRWPVYVNERFCYKEGRKQAEAALKAQGPVEILELDHPISLSIADWVANSLWPSGPAVAGYTGDDMGFAIDVWQDAKGRWVSDFQPAQGIVVEGYDEG